MSRQLVVLDIDDTLYLERDYARSGFYAVDEYLSRLGVNGFGDAAWQAFLDGVRGRIFDVALEAVGAQFPVGDLVAVYRQHRPDIQLLPDARDFLNAAVGRVDLAVVTDGPVASQRAKIEALGLSEWIGELVVTSERGSDWPKPSTRSFAYLQDLFGVRSEDCVYYGDNPAKDFLGPVALGWDAVRVRRPGGLHYLNDDGGGSLRTIDGFDGEANGT